MEEAFKPGNQKVQRAHLEIPMIQQIEGKYTYRGIWQVAYPILISLFMEQMIGMTDTAFLGRVGEVELGASAIAGVYYMVIFVVGFGFSLGSQIIIGRRNGEGKYRDAGKIFWHGLYFLLGFAAVMIALSEALSPWLMSRMVSSGNILDAALTYVRWRILGLFFAYTTAMFRAFYIGTMQTRTLTLNSIVMVLSNVVFNWILIFGHFGIPEWKELKGMLTVSVWTMVENFLSVSTWFIFFLFVEHLGERSLAVSNIVRNISGLIWVILMAFSSTCSTLVSNMIGSGDQDRVPGLIVRVMKMGYAIITSVIILFAIFPKTVIRIFTDMPDIIDATVPAMIVMVSSYLINVAANICFNASIGTGNTRTVFVLEAIALAVYLGYCTLVCTVLKADIAICWTAEHIYALAMLILCGMYLRSGRWKGKRI